MSEAHAQLDLEDRVRWYTKMRWFYLLPLALAGIVPIYIASGFSEDFWRQTTVLVTGLMLNLVFFVGGHWQARRKLFYLALAACQVAFDVLLATWVLFQNGGIESRSVIIYAIPIIMTGALFGRLAIYLTAVASALCYIVLTSLDHYGLIHPPNVAFPSAHTDFLYYLRSVFFYSAVLFVLGVITDFVGRLSRDRERLAQQLLQISAEKAQNEAILKTMGDALVAIDLQGHITLANHSFEEMIGWKQSEVIGRPVDDVLTILNEKGEPLPAERRPLWNTLHGPATQAPQRITDYYYKRKDGLTFPFIAYNSPIVLQGKIIGATTVFQDSTNLQKMQQLRNNFVALASHQLKTPIVEIQGYLENMVSGVVGKLTKEQQAYVKYMYNIAERSTQLLTDLLDITVLEKGSAAINSKPTSLSRILKKVDTIYRGRMSGKHLELKITEKDGDLTVVADHNKLVECIGNVIANAVRFSQAGVIEINTRREDVWAVIDMRDHGTGVDRDAIVALFEKDEVLSAAPTPEGGTGLGLYLAKQLVILQGGSIALTETSNKGTTITIRMPLKGA